MELLPDSGAVARTLVDRVAARSRRRALLRSPFYRTFPYSARVSIFEVDRRVCASTKLRILFNAVANAVQHRAVRPT